MRVEQLFRAIAPGRWWRSANGTWWERQVLLTGLPSASPGPVQPDWSLKDDHWPARLLEYALLAGLSLDQRDLHERLFQGSGKYLLDAGRPLPSTK